MVEPGLYFVSKPNGRPCMVPNLPKIQILFYKKSPQQDFIKRTLASVVVSGLVLGLITLQAGNADDYIAAAMTIDYAATHIGLENRKFSNNKVLMQVFPYSVIL